MLLKIGKVLDTKGLQGELKTSFFYSTIVVKKDDIVFFEKENKILGSYKVEYVKHYKTDKIGRKIYVLKLLGVDSIEKSDDLKKSFIVQEIDHLPQNIFMISELKKCIVVDFNKTMIGKIVDVIEVRQGYNLLVIEKILGEEIFVPFIKETIEFVDIDEKKVVLKNIGGILEQ